MTPTTPLSDVGQLTVTDIFRAVGDDIINKWVAIGNQHGKVHIAFGQAAAELIPEFPAMLVYRAIAIKAGVSESVVRRSHYTVRDIAPELWQKYHMLSYSIFQHAAACGEPEKVLQYAMENEASVRDVEATFPLSDPPEEDADWTARKYPPYFYGIWRELRGRDAATREYVIARMDEILFVISR
jgi:hypothetical protein